MKFVLLDGGSGTELVRLGHPSVEGDPLYSARLLHTDPDAVVTAHKNFLKSGAQVVVTVSYQASVEGLMSHLKVSSEDAYNMMKKSVLLAKQACQEVAMETGHEGKVAGSVGPYGACLFDNSEYTGDYITTVSEQELKDWHRPRIKALHEGGADYVAIETFPCQKEAEVLVELLETEFPDLKAYVTYSCKNGIETCHGEKFSEAIKAVSRSDNIVAVGLNCTSPEYVTSLLESIQGHNIQKPIIVKPNSGELWNADKRWHGKELTLKLEEQAPIWVELGASWIGGCCRVYPDDIGRLKEKLLEIQNGQN